MGPRGDVRRRRQHSGGGRRGRALQPVLLGGCGPRIARPSPRALRLHRPAEPTPAVRLETRARRKIPLRRSKVCFNLHSLVSHLSSL